ncbi:MAG: response regulator [Pirellulales bacterium]
MKILIADDDDISLELLANTLENAGYEVITATNGAEAYDLVRAGAARLVISDWEMPEMTGPELCRAIRRENTDGYVYVMLLTSHSHPDDIVKGLEAGADDFIVKPFNLNELLVRIRAGIRVLSLENREMAIFTLAKLAESRDSETGMHLERVQRYSRLLAIQMAGMPKYADVIDGEMIRLIYQTSPLHDIGKVGIPDCVLCKPGRLSDEEFEIMKQHTLIGADTLNAALLQYPDARFLEVARNIAATHHERWDGRGYPYGLAGEEIPICGRIVALADVYDALTSKRCYKEAFTHHVARSILLKDSGLHFDPDVVDAFLGVEQEFIEINRRLSEDQSHPMPRFEPAFAK